MLPSEQLEAGKTRFCTGPGKMRCRVLLLCPVRLIPPNFVPLASESNVDKNKMQRSLALLVLKPVSPRLSLEPPTMVKIRGTPCMRRHILLHPGTTKYFSKSFVFKNKIEKEGLPSDSPAGLGAGGPEFKSRRPDQKYLACFLLFIESAVHLKPHLWNSGRQEVWIRKSFTF